MAVPTSQVSRDRRGCTPGVVVSANDVTAYLQNRPRYLRGGLSACGRVVVARRVEERPMLAAFASQIRDVLETEVAVVVLVDRKRRSRSCADLSGRSRQGKKSTHSLAILSVLRTWRLRQDRGRAAEFPAETRTYGDGGVWPNMRWW